MNWWKRDLLVNDSIEITSRKAYIDIRSKIRNLADKKLYLWLDEARKNIK